jgi:hypothetical protein
MPGCSDSGWPVKNLRGLARREANFFHHLDLLPPMLFPRTIAVAHPLPVGAY